MMAAMRTMTRRAFLGTGVAVTAAAAGAVVAGTTHRGRRWLHAAGVLDGPDADVPGVAANVEVQRHVLATAHMPSGQVSYRVASPLSGHPSAVLLCLHGRRGDDAYAFDVMGVHRFVAERKLPWTVASVDGGEASYWHRRKDGRDPQAVIFDDLLPRLIGGADGANGAAEAVPVLLLGWSMGGYGALLAAADHSDVVRAVTTSGAAIWRSAGDTAQGAFDDRPDFARNDLFAPARLAKLDNANVRIDCGDDDPFARANRDLADRLPKATARFGAGFHDTATWRSRLPDQLDFLTRALDNT